MPRRLPPEPVLWNEDVARVVHPELTARLARNVRAARASTGLSQERAAERASLSWIYWRQIEAGKGTGNPSLRVLAQIGVALGVDPSALLLRHPPASVAKSARGAYAEGPAAARPLHDTAGSASANAARRPAKVPPPRRAPAAKATRRTKSGKPQARPSPRRG